MKADIVTHNLGSIVSIWAETDAGAEWLDENVPTLAESSGCVEHRYAAPIIIGALNDGLVVQDAATGRFAETPR